MVLTFPRFGESHIYMRLFLKSIGAEYILPRRNTSEVLENGVSMAPEGMCLPYKLFLANLKDAYNRGADTVIMPSPCGPCRLGSFAPLLKLELDKMGCQMDWIVLSAPSEIGFRELLKRLGKICSFSKTHNIDTCGIDETSRQSCSQSMYDNDDPLVLHKQIKKRSRMTNALLAQKRRYKILKNASDCLKIIKQYEDLKDRVCEMAGYARNPHHLNILLKSCRDDLERAIDIRNAFEILGRYRYALEKQSYDRNKRPVRLLLTGEIYTLIEPFANGYLEDQLIEMGVSFIRPLSIGWWIRKDIFNPVRRAIFDSSKNKYMTYRIGGFAKETVVEACNSKFRGIQGVVQILPFGCMPEVVAKDVLNRIASEEDIHIMSLVYDELTDETGYLTRIEAFVDMIQREADHHLLSRY